MNDFSLFASVKEYLVCWICR